MSPPLSQIPRPPLEHPSREWSAATTFTALGGCALLLGTLAQLAGPFRIPWVEDYSKRVAAMAFDAGLPVVSASEARAILSRGEHLLLDARPVEEFSAGHIPGAIPFPNATREIVYNEMAALLDPAQPLIIYCSSLDCDEAILLAVFLRNQGSKNIVLFVNGFSGWKKEGFAVE